MEQEIWKSIESFENLYEVSNQGRIKSLERVIVRSNGRKLHLKERILKPASGVYGRNQYTLSKDGIKFNVRGYVLVAKAFLPNPNQLPEVNHIDGNNKNDCVSNLEWCSSEDNFKHALKNNLFNTYHKRKIKKNILLKGEQFIMMKENSKKVLNYLKSINGTDVTAADVAEALGLEKRSVDGIFTSAIQRKGLGVRTPAEIALEDGTHKQVKFLSLTPAGMTFDPDADEEAAQ